MQSRLGLRELVAVSLLTSILAFTLPADIGDPLALLFFFVCSGLMIGAARKHEGATRQTAWLLAATATLIAVGVLVRGIHGELIGEAQPMPSPADLIHVPGYLIFLATIWRVHRARAVRRDLDAWLDAIAIVLAAVIVMWVVFLGDFILDPEFSVGLRVLNTTYNVIILIAGAILLRITSTPGFRPVSYYILGVSGIAYFVSDIAATYSLIRGTGLTLAVGLSPIVYGLAAAAIRHPTSTMLTRRHREREIRVGPLRLVVVSMTILTPLVIPILGVRNSVVSNVVLVTLSAVLAIVVVARVVRILSLQEQATQLDRSLAEEVGRLAALESAAAVRRELTTSVRRLVPGAAVVRLATGTEGHFTVDLPSNLATDALTEVVLHDHEPSPSEERVLQTLVRDAGLLAASAEGVAASARQESEAVANRKIAENERRFRALVQNSSDVVMVLSGHGTVEYVSDAVATVLGRPGDDFLGRNLNWVLHSNDVDAATKLFVSVLEGNDTQRVHEFRAYHADGTIRLFESIMTDMRHVPEVSGVVLNVSDVTERRSLERDLRDAETIDPLTLQLNRKAFLEEVNTAQRRASVTGSAVAIAIIDLDDFKTLNDALGPMLADRALIETAQRIRRAVRVGDIVARLGGDEFGVLMADGYSENEAIGTAERIIEDLAEPFTIERHPITLTATSGLAIDIGGAMTSTQLLRHADTALTTAKAQLPGRALMFEEAMAARVSERLDLRTGLDSALESGALRLVYQPIVSVESGRIVSMEALARWRHPERGEVSPAVFIPIAEESNAIIKLGEWALRTACAQVRIWDELGFRDFSVSVNMSGHQLREDDVIARVKTILAESRVDPARIVIEITESVLIDDTDFIAERIRMLRALGVSLAIDDFGTGYSSLSYLQRYEFDILKIDRAFVSPLAAEGAKEREIVAAIITLARGLGATTVAEGIEQPDEYAVLQELGCDRAQGYLFHRPIEVGAISATLIDDAATHAQAA